MVQTIARIKKEGKHFEILVNLELALKYKKGESKTVDFLEIDRIFKDSKKAEVPTAAEIRNVFKTDNIYEIAGKIVKEGEVQLTQEFRDAQQDAKYKQVVDFLAKNAVDPRSGNPHTPDRIKTALSDAHVNIKNTPIETQINDIITELSKILPIKIQIKKVKIRIPAIHVGKAYGIINSYKEKEEWLSNGDLEVVVGVPGGMIIDFYDKLNSVTHGSALTEEIKQ
jgi:ribosome maturation protein SDO1